VFDVSNEVRLWGCPSCCAIYFLHRHDSMALFRQANTLNQHMFRFCLAVIWHQGRVRSRVIDAADSQAWRDSPEAELLLLSVG
jgi:hypothetical protein